MNQMKQKIYKLPYKITKSIALLVFIASVIFTSLPRTTLATHASDCSDVFSPLSSFVVNGVNANKGFYVQVMNETGVPWEMLAAIHYRETNFSHTNPNNGQGIFQFVNGDGGPYPPGPVSDPEFVRQLRFMANRVQDDYVNRGSVPRERRRLVANEQNIVIVKDTLFSYNGRASAYANQATHFGYNSTTQPYEGSPYVMNRFDCARARMGIITRDYATGIDGTDTRYGAFTVFARLRGDDYRNSLLTEYSAQLQSSTVYADPSRTQRFSARTTIQPGQKAYARLRIINTGYRTWDQSNTKLGTSKKFDSPSQLYSNTWPSANRAATLTESSVPPGAVGTFDFEVTGPTTGSFVGYFNVVVEGVQWLNDIGLEIGINVVSPVTAPYPEVTLGSGERLNPGQQILSPDGSSVLTLQPDGNLVLRSSFVPTWSSQTSGNAPDRLIMQPDGNLVLYNTSNTPVWYSGTGSNLQTTLKLQPDGNLVIYNSSNAPLWATNTTHLPNFLSYVDQALPTGVMYPRQFLNTADRRKKLIFQPDGNLVLYSNGNPIWASNTLNRGGTDIVMQADGNLVMRRNGQYIWDTKTYGNPNAHLIVQADGNLVIYNNLGLPRWYTSTFSP